MILPRIFRLRSFVRQPRELSSLQQDKKQAHKENISTDLTRERARDPLSLLCERQIQLQKGRKEHFLICAVLSFQGRPSFEITLNSCDVFLSTSLLSARVAMSGVG